MAESTGLLFLKSLWAHPHLSASTCCYCSQPIGSDRILARTYALLSQRPDSSNHAETIQVPSLSETILIYHRHLKCLIESSTPFIVISHVWHPPVSILQFRESAEGVDDDEVAKIVREEPVQIALGLKDGSVDIWHDYISVPQWAPDLKKMIVQAIPRIFQAAKLTIASLSDVDAANVKAMKEGKTIEERCRGVSNICNAKWFSRVWTAMEHTQSREVKAMFRNYELVEDFGVRKPLMNELHDAWNAEVAKKGSPQETEMLVGMGNNLVPWQLGSLELVRAQNKMGKKTHFATAHELLGRRAVTIPQDFFVGLLGILKPGLKVDELSSDMKEALLQVARSCMKSGDYSPLFMIPASARVQASDDDVRSCGFVDLVSFGMGAEQFPPIFKDPMFRNGNPVIRAENIGTVKFIKRAYDHRRFNMTTLSMLLRLALETTGFDVAEIVKTIGARFFGQDTNRIFERLQEGYRERELEGLLRQFYDSYDQWPDSITQRIADFLGLSNTSLNPAASVTPIQFMGAHGGSIHLGRCNSVAGIQCSRCQRTYLIRVALLERGSEVLGTQAYRIPGLKYTFSLPGGAGFLMQNGRIVGRFLWATETCDCEKMEEVEVMLDDLPLPRENRSDYGKKTGRDWYPVYTEKQIKIVAEGKY